MDGTTNEMFRIVVETDKAQDEEGQDVSNELVAVDFTVGNPLSEVMAGRLHLYRLREGGTSASTPSPPLESEILCVLAVPAYMTAADFCNFVTPEIDGIRYMRVLKDASVLNRYMVVIQFQSMEVAEGFAKAYDGKQFTSMSDERCRILPVLDIQYVVPHESTSIHFGTDSEVELPTCPVCLERLDSQASGIVTSLCNHTMHCKCLSQWGDNSCPVCRFCQEPSPESNSCMTCKTVESLWMCLICGHVGCGRYVEFHALSHFKETSHTFSMEMETGRVWDYAGDNYVHRLIMNKTDGKLVELPPRCGDNDEAPSGSGTQKAWRDNYGDRDIEAAQYASKVDALTQEFEYLLTSQLESQRIFYEDRLEKLELDHSSSTTMYEEKLRNIMEENASFREELESLTKEKRVMTKKAHDLEKSESKRRTDMEFLKNLNESLLRNQIEWKEKVEGLESERNRLQEEVRDLLLHFEAIERVSHESELARGDVVGVSTPETGRRRSLRGKGR